jgi:UDP-2,3-diacylglucosamine hydrolase
MFHSANLQLKEGAIIIADAHYGEKYPQLLHCLQQIENREIKTSQLILLGDIFDLLVGGDGYTEGVNREVIETIKRLSHTVEIIYFEGNHDFNLARTFKSIKIIPLQQQPQIFSYQNKKVLVAHGDWDEAFGYQVYSAIVRNRYLLAVLNFLNSLLFNVITNKISKALAKKSICRSFDNFSIKIDKLLKMLKEHRFDAMIEGHFHQGTDGLQDGHFYINVAAFACKKSCFVVKSVKDSLFTLRNIELKGSR